jgi:PAS domain S-box-containing protein
MKLRSRLLLPFWAAGGAVSLLSGLSHGGVSEGRLAVWTAGVIAVSGFASWLLVWLAERAVDQRARRWAAALFGDTREGGIEVGHSLSSVCQARADSGVGQVAARIDAAFERLHGQVAALERENARLADEVKAQGVRLGSADTQLIEEVRRRQQCEQAMQKAVAEHEERVRSRTEELSKTNDALKAEVAQRTEAESALRQLHLELEERVRERTLELALANEMLVKEIDDRRQAEGERQKLVSLVENANDFIALATLEGDITFMNNAARKLLGLDGTRQALLLSVEQIEGDASKGMFQRGIMRSVIAQGGWEGEVQLRNFLDPQRRIEAEVSAILVRDHENGRPVCVALVIRDITDRRVAEAALKELEERFSKAFHASPASIAIITVAEGRFIDVNRNFLSSLGYESHQVHGRTMEDLRLWLSSDAKTKLVDLVARQRSVRDFRCRWLTSAGQTREVEVAAEAVELGAENCILLVAEDITERLQLEDQLRQSQKMEAVGQLAAGIAHDFNNILTVVQGHASLLLSDGNLPRNSTDSVKCVSSAADRAATLTRQLLTFSRKQVAQWREVDVNKVVQNLTRILRSSITESITLSFQYGENLPLIRGDVNMLEQVILNLVVNARDAMTKGGALQIETGIEEVDAEQARRNTKARTGRFVCLSVMDTGCGMDAATMERIFEPFFTTKEFGQGTGLGLATVYGVVTQHNGWIDVTSQVGQGSLFRVFLPAIEGGPRKAVDTSVIKAPEPRGGDEAILVVEDEVGLRMLVEAVLQRQGYRVLMAEHGQEALKVWTEHPGQVHLLLTDMVMPEGLTGLELSEKLRADNPDLRIIYMSGYSVDFMENEVTGIQEGFNFLQKPYRPEQLVRAVREVLDAPPQPLPRRAEVPPARAA